MRIWIEGDVLINNSNTPNVNDPNPCGHQEQGRQVCHKNCGLSLYFNQEIRDSSIPRLYFLIEYLIQTIIPDAPIVPTMPPESLVREAILSRNLGTLISIDPARIPNFEWILYHLYPILHRLILPAINDLPRKMPLVFSIRFDRGLIKFGVIIGC